MKVYRTKQKRLLRFLYDIEHFDPTFTWRPGRLNQYGDAMSGRPGLKEEGQPADTSQFFFKIGDAKPTIT